MFKVLKNNIFAICIGGSIIIISVLPFDSLPKYNIRFSDKIIHIIMYFMLLMSFFIDRVINNRTVKLSSRQILFDVIYAICFGILLEAVQWALPYRSASLYDIVANFIGIITGVVFIKIILYFFFCKSEQI